MSKALFVTCSVCNKKAESKGYFTFDGIEYVDLKCGHLLVNEKNIIEADYSDFVSSDGRSLYPFQVEGCRFAENAGFSCLIADEMGLGKTVQALALIKKHENLLPVLIITKTALKHQWFSEVVRWTGLVPQILESGDLPIPVFKVFIISIDLLRSYEFLEDLAYNTIIIDECQSIKNISSKRTHYVRLLTSRSKELIKKEINESRIKMIAEDLFRYHGISERFKLLIGNLGPNKLGICKCKATKDGIIEGEIILSHSHLEKDSEDEIIETILHEIAHAITPGAGHVKIWRDTALAIGSNGEAIKYCDGTIESITTKVNVIALSGTPIKNRIDEYFPILNILRPDLFYSQQSFMRNWVGTYFDGKKTKAGRLVDPIGFKNRTKDFIIRRERNEVLPDLPKINRTFSYSELEKEAEKHYKILTKQFTEFFDENEGKVTGKNTSQTLAYLARMRHCTGLAKINPVIEFVSTFLEDTDRKLTIFVHHKDVGEKIKILLHDICKENDVNPPLNLTSDLSGEERNEVVMKFKDDGLSRILIASTLASGEGLNLQFCSDCIMVERQWNPANEEQAEGRFSRIGSLADKINATYMTAIGTVDEFFMQLVEAKRKIVNEAMTGKKVNWQDDDILSELSSMIVKHGRKAWGF